MAQQNGGLFLRDYVRALIKHDPVKFRQESQLVMANAVLHALWHEQHQHGRAAVLVERAVQAGNGWVAVLKPRLEWMMRNHPQRKSTASAVLDPQWRSQMGFGPTFVDAMLPWAGLMWGYGHSEIEALLGTDGWRALFDAIGYTSMEPTPDGKFLQPGVAVERPTEPVTLYRGCLEQFNRRWSWTPERDTAAGYATHLGKFRGDVWVAQVEPERLLARIETTIVEFVVDTRGLEIQHLREFLPNRPYASEPLVPRLPEPLWV